MEQQLRPGLPENAKLVFKGVIFEVWHWEQKMFDGSIETFEKIWRYPTVNVIATVGDKIIIEEQSQPDNLNFITCINGRGDSGNTDMLEEAKREMLEETGYVSDDWILREERKGKGKIIWDMYDYIARNCKKIQEQKLDAGEKIEVKLIGFDEFLALADNPRLRMAESFVYMLKELQRDEAKREAFKKLLFG